MGFVSDFGVQKSIVSTDGGYLLKPVIRVVSLVISGAISGWVHPLEAFPYISATSDDGDAIQTELADPTDGRFALIGLPEGYYDVHIDPTTGQYCQHHSNRCQSLCWVECRFRSHNSAADLCEMSSKELPFPEDSKAS